MYQSCDNNSVYNNNRCRMQYNYRSVDIKEITMLILVATLFACGDSKTDTAASLVSETSNETAPSMAGDPNDGVLDTMEEYISSYCSEYAMRCGGIYGTQEECETSFLELWGDMTCTVHDTSLLEECVDWLSTFTCEGTGWIDACDNFYTCE